MALLEYLISAEEIVNSPRDVAQAFDNLKIKPGFDDKSLISYISSEIQSLDTLRRKKFANLLYCRRNF